MRAIVKKPGKIAEVTEIENSFKALQAAVGGYVECVSLSEGIVLIVNEEGKLRGLAPNVSLSNDVLVGTIIACGENKHGEFIDITDRQIAKFTKDFKLGMIAYNFGLKAKSKGGNKQ